MSVLHDEGCDAWMETASGRKILLGRPPDPAEIDLEDIAHSLSRQCRFAGHTLGHYSVAEHSVLVSFAAPAFVALEALMHDAHEAYIGDITSPVKAALRGLDDGIVFSLGALEDRMEAAVRERFGLTVDHNAEVAIKAADMKALAAERAAMLPRTGRHDWRVPYVWPEGVPRPLLGIPAHDARNLFVCRYYEAATGRGCRCDLPAHDELRDLGDRLALMRPGR